MAVSKILPIFAPFLGSAGRQTIKIANSIRAFLRYYPCPGKSPIFSTYTRDNTTNRSRLRYRKG